MNRLEELVDALALALPACEHVIRKPRNPDGVWILDISYRDRKVIVEWAPKRGGFGVSPEMDDVGYGEGPEEVFTDKQATHNRVLELLGVQDPQ